ncbi:glycoside hydrolase 43 family protein [Aquisalinus flavus]|uniref:Beta-xylosidase n=1 Tax=Aquisalinus flavus TaxID=1526572 RepID=A0A8J2V2B5_9PROT|nr:glycoside hydrolase 43 family protein [Aquisalinus flavus]MBD0426400.1 glycoside hydrolase 43 family protein [Aquisalinus flavus]UNE48041.1 glycosyl hydrolase 43 family protein [Aquisalinus flavus]GGD08253.1 beta-xylosidase [Aquisalinus flavus]
MIGKFAGGLAGAVLGFACIGASVAQDERPLRESWSADNGNGTYTNPLFYDEFSDPDMIRVGDDYYLTGTTMHSMPGLPVLHSTDLVNWEFLSYAMDRLDLGPAFRLEGDGEEYGQGLWAPTFRHYDGTFYIFSNVNRHKTQIFTATDPCGPWTHSEMDESFHDLSILFDDDGKAYIVWGYQQIRVAELNEDLTNIIPGTEQVVLEAGSGLGEGIHFYKFDGTYFLISAEYRDSMRMPAARAPSPYGPWEVIRAISEHEDFGLMKGRGIATSDIFLTGQEPPFALTPADPASRDRLSLHQGGIVETPEGEWWGFSMYDANSIGRLTALSPVTWKDGWPWFGLPGNLERTPRTWVKPATGPVQSPKAPYARNGDFDGPGLANVWQWNHVPVEEDWSLTERPGYLRLKADAAENLLRARTTLTQRAIGPRSVPTAILDTTGMAEGDRAGLALFNRPYGYIAVERTADGFDIIRVNENEGGVTDRVSVDATRVWLRADADFMSEEAQFSWSVDGETFEEIGEPFFTVYQLYTFQGVRYALFAFNPEGETGGQADFDSFKVHEPAPYGLAPIPFGRSIDLTVTMLDDAPQADILEHAFDVVDVGQGRVRLEREGRALTVAKDGEVSLAKAGRDSQHFQWSETPTGEIVLMSLVTNRFLRVVPETGALLANSPGPDPDGQDGVRFTWVLAKE